VHRNLRFTGLDRSDFAFVSNVSHIVASRRGVALRAVFQQSDPISARHPRIELAILLLSDSRVTAKTVFVVRVLAWREQVEV
jgi:hypothetical protein